MLRTYRGSTPCGRYWGFQTHHTPPVSGLSLGLRIRGVLLRPGVVHGSKLRVKVGDTRPVHRPAETAGETGEPHNGPVRHGHDVPPLVVFPDRVPFREPLGPGLQRVEGVRLLEARLQETYLPVHMFDGLPSLVPSLGLPCRPRSGTGGSIRGLGETFIWVSLEERTNGAGAKSRPKIHGLPLFQGSSGWRVGNVFPFTGRTYPCYVEKRFFSPVSR